MTTTLKSIAAGQIDQRAKPTNFPAMLDSFKAEIARALPRHLNPDAMTRIALTCFRMNPKLAECQPSSVFACVIQASQLGLRPGLLGECYLIPFKDQCTLQIGYQGLLELVRRSGLVDSISAHVVREADAFDVQWGTDPGITHRPFLDGDAGHVRLVYAVARLKGGGSHAELMTLTDIERIRMRSQNVANAARFGKKTPWDTDWDEMARKTVLRRICKYLPKSPDLASALALDDAAFRGQQQISVQDAIGNTFVPPAIELDDEPTGEVEAPTPAPEAPTAPPRARRTPAAAPAAPTEEVPDQQHLDPGSADAVADRQTYAQFADSVLKATGAEAASLVLDEARSELNASQLTELSSVFQRKWGGN